MAKIQHDSHEITLKFSVANSVNIDQFQIESISNSFSKNVGTINGTGTDSLVNNYSFVSETAMDEHPKTLTYTIKPISFDLDDNGRCDIEASLWVDDISVLELARETTITGNEIRLSFTVN